LPANLALRSDKGPWSVAAILSPLKTRFIVNLHSRGGATRIAAVKEFAQTRGAEVRTTKHTGHAFMLAGEAIAEGCELVVAVGGDGTMNEVATALVATPAILGLIPAGSGDGLGRHLGLHGSVRHALHVIGHGRIQLIDTGIADGHAFFCAAGLGFEAEIAQRFNQLRRRGFLRYLLTSAQTLRSWRALEYRISSGDFQTTRRAFTLVVANACQYGNNARIAPRAQVNDGELDLSVVPPLTAWNAVPLATRLFSGSIDSARNMICRRTTHVVVERAEPGLLHTDGEVHQAGTRVEFSIRPASLRVLTPA